MIRHIVMSKLKAFAESASRGQVHPKHETLRTYVAAVREVRECADYAVH